MWIVVECKSWVDLNSFVGLVVHCVLATLRGLRRLFGRALNVGSVVGAGLAHEIVTGMGSCHTRVVFCVPIVFRSLWLDRAFLPERSSCITATTHRVLGRITYPLERTETTSALLSVIIEIVSANEAARRSSQTRRSVRSDDVARKAAVVLHRRLVSANQPQVES